MSIDMTNIKTFKKPNNQTTLKTLKHNFFLENLGFSSTVGHALLGM